MSSRFRDQLTEQIAHLTPQDLERDQVGVVMCGLLADIADLLDALTATQRDEQAPAGPSSDGPGRDDTTVIPAPTDPGEEEDGSVQLLEPDMPASDDETGAAINDARDQAVTARAATAGKPGRPARRKATKPAAKTPTGE